MAPILIHRTMEAVKIMLRTIFWTLPALSRVEPVRTSGPGEISMGTSATRDRGDPSLQERETVAAPTLRAYFRVLMT